MDQSIQFSPAILSVIRHIARHSVALSVLVITASLASSTIKAEDQKVDFQREVAPLLEANCLRCHGSESPEGDFSLSTGAASRKSGFVVPGKPEQSHLLTVVQPDGDQPPAMPKEGKPLTTSQVAVLRHWIKAGAAWPEGVTLRVRSKADSTWWSLQPVARPRPPKTASTSENPIDHFVRAKLDERSLTPSPAADRRVLIRRLYFDLLGLPPTPEAVASFVADPNPKAYEQLVDELLASKHLGERWARHWLDIAHYADTHGFERDKRRDNAWRYRDYVIRSFNNDKPYDQFLIEQIAGDALDAPTDESIIATGFLAAGPWDFVGQVETKSPILNRAARALDLDDMLTQVMTSTVAMTANCARCHDHKLDPITQREYYQLAAVFAGVRRDNRDINPERRKQYNGDKAGITESISQVSAQIGQLQGKGLDLADIVGGGNGFRTGKKGLGIDARTGKVQERPFGDLGNVKPGNYAPCNYPFVDGVFVPASGQTRISSTGLIAHNLPETSGKAWDMIRHGPVSSQYSTTLGTIDYNSASHSMIGLHANAGITFDIAAIRNAGQKKQATEPDNDSPQRSAVGSPEINYQFTTVAGYGGRTVEPSAEFRIYLDGELKSTGRLGRNDTTNIAIEIPTTSRFLTLISTDGGNGYSHDQISFGDPRLTVSTPATLTDKRKAQLAQLQRKKALLEAELKELGEPPEFYGVVSETPPAVHILTRGNPEAPGDTVGPGTLGFGEADIQFGSVDTPDLDRRLALAKWITSPDNPLTRRVIVNRLWHWHFGTGLVDTPSDFGFGGGQPTHPKLLDWLADELLRSGWSLKHIHRLIVTSQTYQQQSVPAATDQRVDPAAVDPAATDQRVDPAAVDPTVVDSDNRLLWRMNPHRLEAEAVRDSVLAVSGKLNATMFGPGYRDFDYKEAYAPIYTYQTADSPPLWRRSIYRFIVRTTPQQFMTALDCPDPANLTPKRNITTTALQSLALYNNEFMLKQSRYFAERLAEEPGSNIDDQVERAFQLAFARSPDAKERELSRKAIVQHGLWQFCRAMLNANEFIYID
jgi:hypothetical protein